MDGNYQDISILARDHLSFYGLGLRYLSFLKYLLIINFSLDIMDKHQIAKNKIIQQLTKESKIGEERMKKMVNEVHTSNEM